VPLPGKQPAIELAQGDFNRALVFVTVAFDIERQEAATCVIFKRL
jgi:hypothetical protein